MREEAQRLCTEYDEDFNFEFEDCSLKLAACSFNASFLKNIHRRLFAMPDQKDKPPLFETWRQWYLLVAGFLFVLILLFYLITKTFA